MGDLKDKKILLGVSGGIAAYKSAELVRLLTTSEATVRVVMTPAATQFVAPLTFQALSNNPVRLSLLDSNEENGMDHIHLARWADHIIIAPATADFLAKISLGLADDLLSTLCLATGSPISVAPAMNRGMWKNTATQENVSRLKKRGIQILGPDSGNLACGETGEGRMRSPEEICVDLKKYLNQRGGLQGNSVLVTAGPTREALDPVRYFSNRSSGKMGYAIAVAAKNAGASVTLVSGPVSLLPPDGIRVIAVESAHDMFNAVMEEISNYQIFVGTAAVSDYKPSVVASEKIKKDQDQLLLTLDKNPDILASVAKKEGIFTVGFAAETHHLERYAKAKLRDKQLDMIAANWVSRDEGGFENNENALQVYWPDGNSQLAMAPKTILADRLIELIAERFHAKNTT
ncbi:MAG: bifunctional phosphopantothenoylcysteine decarboxylase/phosphopantothenate--cysteine ligase CoaBC [Methylococcales bacterium]